MTTLTCLSSKVACKNIMHRIYETYMMKYGKSIRLKPPHFFKKCRYSKLECYSYKAYKKENNRNLVSLVPKTIKKIVSQFGTASLPNISPTTLLKGIKEIALVAISSLYMTYRLNVNSL